MRGLIHHVRIIEKRPPDVTVRAWRQIRHGTMKTMGLHWHATMLPNHFAPNASNVYKYKQRTKGYLKQKAWFMAKGKEISKEEVMAETLRTMPKGLKAGRGQYEDVFWRQYQKTRERMLEEAGSPVRPLYYRGTLFRNVTQIATIRSFEQRFKLVMPGTSYTPARPRNPRMPPLAMEVTTLLQREKEELAKLGKAFATAQLQTIRESRITEI